MGKTGYSPMKKTSVVRLLHYRKQSGCVNAKTMPTKHLPIAAYHMQKWKRESHIYSDKK